MHSGPGRSKLVRPLTRSLDTEPHHLMDLPMPDLISVTSDNVDEVLPDLPRVVRLALGFGSKLRRGTLDVTLPDGRMIRLGGMEPGPSAAMTLCNYGFASRLVYGGGPRAGTGYFGG